MKNKKKRPDIKKPDDKVLRELRGRIAGAIQANHPELEEGLSGLQFAIGTFAPSEIMKKFVISDYPFIGSRYVSLRDGHVYIVAGTTDDGEQVVAYRLGFFRSIFTVKGGAAVAITPDGWMENVMIMFSLYHAGFSMNRKKEIVEIHDEHPTRRSYPVKKARCYFEFIKGKLMGFATPLGVQEPDQAES